MQVRNGNVYMRNECASSGRASVHTRARECVQCARNEYSARAHAQTFGHDLVRGAVLTKAACGSGGAEERLHECRWKDGVARASTRASVPAPSTRVRVYACVLGYVRKEESERMNAMALLPIQVRVCERGAERAMSSRTSFAHVFFLSPTNSFFFHRSLARILLMHFPALSLRASVWEWTWFGPCYHVEGQRSLATLLTRWLQDERMHAAVSTYIGANVWLNRRMRANGASTTTNRSTTINSSTVIIINLNRSYSPNQATRAGALRSAQRKAKVSRSDALNAPVIHWLRSNWLETSHVAALRFHTHLQRRSRSRHNSRVRRC
eukprot:6187268-Pleurochrysis_carterae.AAC.1